jgi:hypothetical protein
MAKNEDDPAKLAILQEWDVWAQKKGLIAHAESGMLFYSHLKRNRPDLLLDFKYSGDKWEIVHAWLLRARKVRY